LSLSELAQVFKLPWSGYDGYRRLPDFRLRVGADLVRVF